MNWALLAKVLPIALKIAREIIEAIAENRGDKKAIRKRIAQRVADPDVLLDEEIDQLDEDEDDLLDYVRTGR